MNPKEEEFKKILHKAWCYYTNHSHHIYTEELRQTAKDIQQILFKHGCEGTVYKGSRLRNSEVNPE